MKKNFILDTNVLLHDPNALLSFDDNDIIVPIYVIEEIDRFKRDLSELGRNARADALGITAQDFDLERVTVDEIYSGFSEFQVSKEKVDEFYREQILPVSELGEIKTVPNLFVHLKDETDENHTALGRMDPAGDKLAPLIKVKGGIWGVTPRNREQTFAFDLLLDDRIKLVTMAGKAGTGKTLLALAAGLHKVVEDRAFHRLLVSRPIFPLGRDIGYLPGDVEDKLSPWMQPIFDNVEFLLNLSQKDKRQGRSYRELMDMDIIEIEPLTYIRGRSIPNQYIIIDEAQNLTPHEVKTIITRAGDGTKVVMTGDLYQIDNPYVDSSNNGLSYLVNRFRGKPLSGHITLRKGERSELAELASDIL
jgi:PhoH-like ATPase